MLRDPYRPERHYMRGPGPKTRAKQFAAAAVVDHAASRKPKEQSHPSPESHGHCL
jgi:hypothetical protein